MVAPANVYLVAFMFILILLFMVMCLSIAIKKQRHRMQKFLKYMVCLVQMYEMPKKAKLSYLESSRVTVLINVYFQMISNAIHLISIGEVTHNTKDKKTFKKFICNFDRFLIPFTFT